MNILEDVTTLYDDRVAMLRTCDVLPNVRTRTLRDIEAALTSNEDRLRVALQALDDTERDDIMYELDNESRPYSDGAWEYMSGLL